MRAAPARSNNPRARAGINQYRSIMTYFITGAAGFIGSQLADRLLANGETVVGYDNLSTGKMRFLEQASANSNFRFVKGDLLDTQTLTRAMSGATFVFHLAANADVRFGTEHPER